MGLGASAAWYALRPRALPVLGTLPPFSLTERAGRSVSAADLAGQVWIADFIFTRCPDICPALTAQMARLQTTLPPASDPVRLVSFSVDPAHDTPAVLRDYATRSGARDGWLFLTGSRDQLALLLREGFRLAFADDGPASAPITHSDRFVLVDRELRIRGYYHGTEPGALGRLARDAAGLRDGHMSVLPLTALPSVNAVLNGLSVLFLAGGYLAIRSRRVRVHRACMLVAFVTSTLFLASYLTYHLQVGTTRFTGAGWVRPLYFTILGTHTALAVLIPPLAIVTLTFALRRRFQRHARLARWTLPTWLYVSVTGVVIYFLLYC